MAPKITLTEQRLCKIWAAAQLGGDFYDTSKTLHEIAAVLNAEGKQDAGAMFGEASALALHRAIEDIKVAHRPVEDFKEAVAA